MFSVDDQEPLARAMLGALSPRTTTHKEPDDKAGAALVELVDVSGNAEPLADEPYEPTKKTA